MDAPQHARLTVQGSDPLARAYPSRIFASKILPVTMSPVGPCSANLANSQVHPALPSAHPHCRPSAVPHKFKDNADVEHRGLGRSLPGGASLYVLVLPVPLVAWLAHSHPGQSSSRVTKRPVRGTATDASEPGISVRASFIYRVGQCS